MFVVHGSTRTLVERSTRLPGFPKKRKKEFWPMHSKRATCRDSKLIILS